MKPIARSMVYDKAEAKFAKKKNPPQIGNIVMGKPTIQPKVQVPPMGKKIANAPVNPTMKTVYKKSKKC